MSTNKKQPYKIVGPATWELIRASYLAGESAATLAERYDVSQHAIRRRATLERWTKRAYAEALEARGLPPPERPPKLNVAARFAAGYAPAPPPSEPEHPFMELVAALKEASAAAEGAQARAFDEAAARPPSEQAAELERRALAQVAAALEKGKAGDAKALAALAEQMRKRVEEERVAQAAETEAEERGAAMMEEMAMQLFGKVAYLAGAMVHSPATAPAAFLALIKRWRELNLGEDEEDAEKRAAKIAEAHARYVDGSWVETTPEDVREYLAGRWAEMRVRMETL